MSDENTMTDTNRNLTYKQRYGYEELPAPMRVGELSDDFRREIWNLTSEFFTSVTRRGQPYFTYYEAPTEMALKRILASYEKKFVNHIEVDTDETPTKIENSIVGGFPENALQLIEIMANELKTEKNFVKSIADLFQKHSAPYYLDISKKPFRIFQHTSAEEKDATLQSLQKINEAGFTAALSHLRGAADHINSGKFADSIRDSISAVESVARAIAPDTQTLGRALNKLDKKGFFKHPALKDALEQLYGYTNAEQGIRHARIDIDATDVEIAEALFFYNACASFVGYLATVGNVK